MNYIKNLHLFARIFSLFSIGFILFFLIAHLIGDDFGQFNSIQEKMMFLFFPIGVCAGQMIAWKWELIGGSVTGISIIGFHILEKKYSIPIIDGLALPGLLFMLSGLFYKKD